MTTPYLALTNTDDFGLLFSDEKYTVTLGLTATALTVPGTAPRYKAVMKVESAGLVYVANNGTAAVPVGSTFAASTSELITDAKALCREVKAGDILSFITAGTDIDVSVAFYALGTTVGV